MQLSIVCGFQTGADQAGARAAKRLGLPTSGWLPKGFLTEDGPRPDFVEMYGAKEHSSSAYPPRTHQNAADADLTIWVGRTGSPGYWCTKKGCDKAKKPFREVLEPFPTGAAAWVIADMIRRSARGDEFTLNVAGPRESSCPGIGERAEAFFVELFGELMK